MLEISDPAIFLVGTGVAALLIGGIVSVLIAMNQMLDTDDDIRSKSQVSRKGKLQSPSSSEALLSHSTGSPKKFPLLVSRDGRSAVQ